MSFSETPEALKPIYYTAHQTGPIKLFDGKLSIHKNDESLVGDGFIRVEWRPFPRIGLKINCYPEHPFKYPPIGKVHLEAPDDPSINFDVYINRVYSDRKSDRFHQEVLGDLTQPETIPEVPIDCSELRFHLINLKPTSMNLSTMITVNGMDAFV